MAAHLKEPERRTKHEAPPRHGDAQPGQGRSILMGYLALLGRIAFIALVTWLLFTQVFLLMQNRGTDMFPNIKDGDLIMGFRLQSDYEQDDPVVYLRDGQHRVGRIVAAAGDNVDMTEDGVLRVNGTVQAGEIMYPTYPRDTVQFPYTVPEGSVFILADYRTQAEDSRDFGAVALDDVEARVITILRRRGL